MLKFFRSLYLHQNLFYWLAALSLCFFLGHWLPLLFELGRLLALFLIVCFLADVIWLFQSKHPLVAKRIPPERFSNGDWNPVSISLENRYNMKIRAEVIDEIPVQFQKRDFKYVLSMAPYAVGNFEYLLRPVERGEYIYGKLNVYAFSILRLAKRRFSFQQDQMVPVYPSYIQMKKYDFLAISNKLTDRGIKKIRRIGNTMEFEQIKEYTSGDDYRTVNWKATAKRAELMVNQYQDERAQPIYSIIDTGRVMKMPFEELKLLDYAINASLAFSNVALKRHDKVGLLAFSKTIEKFLPAKKKISWLNNIMQSLYNIDTAFTDSSFEWLYSRVQREITHRSLLILYTNFEHISSLKRALPYLTAIAKKHLLVVVFFENIELTRASENFTHDTQGIFHQTIVEKFIFEKSLMIKTLNAHGIQTILTPPAELTINTINKYLEIKARGLL